MKTIFRMLSVLLLTTGLLSSCIQIGEGIQPSKKLITRDYKVKEFNKIDAGTVGNIYYTQSTDGKTDRSVHTPCLSVCTKSAIAFSLVDRLPHPNTKQKTKGENNNFSFIVVIIYFIVQLLNQYVHTLNYWKKLLTDYFSPRPFSL